MKDLVKDYVDEISSSDDFKELKRLKNLIDSKYQKEIMAFKTNESLYNDSISYASYRSDIDDIKKKFIESKAKLYSFSEVKEYFALERKIQNKLNLDLDEIKKAIGVNTNDHKCIKK